MLALQICRATRVVFVWLALLNLAHSASQYQTRQARKRLRTYTIKQGDGLMAIVRKAFKLQDPQDTPEIVRLVNLIAAQNGITNRDRIKPGDMLTLHYLPA
jgi:hypothetical protein